MAGTRCVLRLRDGAARRVDELGLLIGRLEDCDIVVADEGISRRHALVRVDCEGAEVVPFGKTPVLCNGAPVDRPQRLADGDRLAFGPLELTVELAREDAARARFMVTAGGASCGITRSAFSLGGAPNDDLILAGWPPRAAVLYATEDSLYVEPDVDDLACDGQPLTRHELAALEPGARLARGATTLVIGQALEHARTTVGGDAALPHKVVLELLPRGGRLVLSLAGGEYCVYLPDKRLDLIAALLRPPSGYAAGDYLPDDVLRPLVWPRNPGVSRSEINVHITRCRKDLVTAGLPGPRLIQRSPTGGATRFAIHPRCHVELIT